MSFSPVKNGDAGAGGPGQGNVINLMNLQPQQLQQLKQQVDQELQFYQQAVMSLKEVQIKMQESGACVKSLKPGKSELLVPVTGSMFIRGELEDKDRVLVDVGTGYFVEKSIDDGIDYFKRKVEFLTDQIEKVQAIGREKSQVRAAITEVLTGKLQQEAQLQKKAGTK